MYREDPILVAWSGEESHGAALHSEIVRALATLRTGRIDIDHDPDGQEDHEIVDLHATDGSDEWWRIVIRHDRVNIERGNRADACFVTLDRLNDSMIPGSLGDETRTCAEAHLAMAERLLSSDAVRDSEVEDRLQRIADDLAFHVHVRHGPCREAMAIVVADSPFGIGRSSGYASFTGLARAAMPPTTTPSFLEHVDASVGRAVRVAVESPSIACIGTLSATAHACPNVIDVLRELSDERGDRGWTT